MAKKSMIAKQAQRVVLVERHKERRAELKRLISHPDTGHDERMAAVTALAKLPRDSSATRLRNRDVIDGRPRAYNRKFGLSRVRLRELAHRGELPGVRKASWLTHLQTLLPAVCFIRRKFWHNFWEKSCPPIRTP